MLLRKEIYFKHLQFLLFYSDVDPTLLMNMMEDFLKDVDLLLITTPIFELKFEQCIEKRETHYL